MAGLCLAALHTAALAEPLRYGVVAYAAIKSVGGEILWATDAAETVIGCDHGQIGAALMTLWKLPESYREVAANHHNPSGSRSPSVVTAAVHIADLLVTALALGGNGESGLPRFCAEAWDLVGLPPSDLGRVAESLLSLLDETLRLFTEK